MHLDVGLQNVSVLGVTLISLKSLKSEAVQACQERLAQRGYLLDERRLSQEGLLSKQGTEACGTCWLDAWGLVRGLLMPVDRLHDLHEDSKEPRCSSCSQSVLANESKAVC